MIDYINDYDNQYFRIITIALAKTLSKQLRWINYFEPLNENETGRKRVVIPFYTSLTGDQRFCFDLFVDDIIDKRVMLNTDQFQRGVISLESISTRTSELANPNQYISKNTIINDELKKIISKVKAVPITISYNVEIHLATMNEVDKCMQKLLDVFYNYMFFHYEYYGLKIDAIITLPDDKTITINKEINLETDRKKIISYRLDVKTYYPIFQINTDDLIVCDNDDEINWEELNISRPTYDYINSLKKLNEKFNIVTYNDKGETEGMSEIKKTYWKFYLNFINDKK